MDRQALHTVRQAVAHKHEVTGDRLRAVSAVKQPKRRRMGYLRMNQRPGIAPRVCLVIDSCLRLSILFGGAGLKVEVATQNGLPGVHLRLKW